VFFLLNSLGVCPISERRRERNGLVGKAGKGEGEGLPAVQQPCEDVPMPLAPCKALCLRTGENTANRESFAGIKGRGRRLTRLLETAPMAMVIIIDIKLVSYHCDATA